MYCLSVHLEKQDAGRETVVLYGEAGIGREVCQSQDRSELGINPEPLPVAGIRRRILSI